MCFSAFSTASSSRWIGNDYDVDDCADDYYESLDTRTSHNKAETAERPGKRITFPADGVNWAIVPLKSDDIAGQLPCEAM